MDEKLVKQEIQKLVDKFERIKEEGKYKKYNEENTKKDFILPLFRALGWNVEDSDEVKAEEKVSKKRVDYAFRINGIPKFFLEAKSLKEYTSNSKYISQAIEYAYNKSLPWAILCNFETLRVFNAEFKFNEKNPLQNVVLDLRYTDYLDVGFEKLLWLSKDGFENRILDTQATIIGKKIRKLPISKQLLIDFTEYREILTKDILKQNLTKKLSQDELDEIVQRILDRIIFIRTCEDKKIESEKLESLVRIYGENEGELYRELNKRYRYYDEGYNSKLFTKHICEDVIISNDALKEVILGTYKTKEITIKYDFSAIDADVLGNIYEQYLGHILKSTAKRAKLTNGKVHRKQQGIYYTPIYIVEYIVRNTVGEKLKKRGIKVDDLKILDPACGSGSFLLKAFDFLWDYTKKKDKKAHQTRFEDISRGKLFKRKTELLKNTIFGVDLDTKAVEITQLNLLLKLAEKRQRLPMLVENIKCGDSLIDDKNIIGDNALDWEEKFESIMDEDGFDLIIGNPPYVFTREKEFEKETKEYFQRNYSDKIDLDFKSRAQQSGKLNLFALFLIKGINLLKNKGVLGYIIPNTILRVNTYIKLRKFILENCKILSIIDTGTDVFSGVTASTVIILLQKENSKKIRDRNKIEILKLSANEISEPYYIPQEYFVNNNNFVFNILAKDFLIKILDKIEKDCIQLGDGIAKSYNGIATKRDKDKYISDTIKNTKYKPLLVGKDIKQYRIDFTNKYINYDREILHRPRDENIFLNKEKIITQRISGGTDPIIATIDTEQYYTFNSVNNLLIKDTNFSSKYILALLNSQLLNWYYIMKFTNMSFLTVNISKTNLEQLPIKNISLKEQKPFIDIVTKLLDCNKKLNKYREKNIDKRKQLENEIDKLDIKLNNMIYDLYKIKKKKIDIIKKSLQK